jgi:Ala-tRNA(Pro) deacylase
MILVESAFRFSLLFEHDLFRKPVSTFRDHALMPATPDELFAYLNTLGIAHKTVTHPAVFTVEEARELRGAISGGHTKNLFLRDKKGALYLLVAPEDAAIELRSLHRLLGASGRFSFGSAELLQETLGVAPGSVTPFAVINDKEVRVALVIDAALTTHDMLNFHPLVNTATTSISRDGLLKFLAATGHAPRIEPLSGAPE